jgi:hypothetical protein
LQSRIRLPDFPTARAFQIPAGETPGVKCTTLQDHRCSGKASNQWIGQRQPSSAERKQIPDPYNTLKYNEYIAERRSKTVGYG